MPIALISRLVPADQPPQPGHGFQVLPGGSPRIEVGDGRLHIVTGVTPIAGAQLREEWLTDCGPATSLEDGPLSLVQTETLLFAAYRSPDPGILVQTETAYRRLFTTMAERGFGHALRVWNYMGQIHSRLEAQDHYQAFCVGRARALEGLGLAESGMPAATAIGTPHPGLLVYAIAAREGGTGVENPRQVSAYRYPPQYSPERPAFARATRVHTDSGPRLLVSGTASIVGHASMHPGDPALQAEEILRNLRALGDASGIDSPQPAWLRVYLRSADDRRAVQQVLETALRDPLPIHWVVGDICREDLLVEIEGVYAGAG